LSLQKTNAELIIYKYKALDKESVKNELITAATQELELKQYNEVRDKIFIVDFDEETERQAFDFKLD